MPTVRRSSVIEDVADQLHPGDELLVVCDSRDDPVATGEDDFPDGVRLVVAGEPDGCSGKANAVAAGIETARHERIVLTDDDYYHPPDWLATLHADYERHGPVSEVPFFVGKDLLSLLLEPHYNVSNVVGLYEDDNPWGGTVVFDRTDLDEAALCAALRRTVSDDGVINEYLSFTTVKRTRQVEIGGTVRETLERHVRFVKIAFSYMSLGMQAAYTGSWLLAAIVLLWFPLGGVLVTTVAAGATYAYIGVPRWTFVLAYPGLVVGAPLLVYAIARRTFVWGGRRYRWVDRDDVRIVESV